MTKSNFDIIFATGNMIKDLNVLTQMCYFQYFILTDCDHNIMEFRFRTCFFSYHILSKSCLCEKFTNGSQKNPTMHFVTITRILQRGQTFANCLDDINLCQAPH